MTASHDPLASTPTPARRFSRVGRSVKLAGALMAIGLVAAACGSSSTKSSTAGSTGAASTSTAAPSTSASSSASAVQTVHSSPTVDERTIAGLGTVLTDSQGRTLYMFASDKQKAVTCTSAACLKAWPPLAVSGKPTAGPGVKSSLLGTIKSGGKTIVTYDHWPLYTFIEDTAAGVAKGQAVSGFGASWYVLSPAGTVIKTAPSSSSKSPSTTTPSGSTGGSTAY